MVTGDVAGVPDPGGVELVLYPISYPVIGAPPSQLGVHEATTEVGPMLDMIGAFGALGIRSVVA